MLAKKRQKHSPKPEAVMPVLLLCLLTAVLPMEAKLPPVLQSFTDDDRVKDAPEDKVDEKNPEAEIFKVRTTNDEKLQARSEIYFLTDKITSCRDRSLHIPGLDLSTLPRERRETLEQSLAAIRARQLASLLNRRGTSLAILGDNSRALNDLDEAVNFDAEYAPAYNNRAWLRAQKGELKEALTDVNKALELAPKMAEAYDTRGAINLVLKKTGDAIEDFNVSINCNPRYAEAYFHRSIAHKLMGNLDKYKEDESRAKELEKQALFETETGKQTGPKEEAAKEKTPAANQKEEEEPKENKSK